MTLQVLEKVRRAVGTAVIGGVMIASVTACSGAEQSVEDACEVVGQSTENLDWSALAGDEPDAMAETLSGWADRLDDVESRVTNERVLSMIEAMQTPLTELAELLGDVDDLMDLSGDPNVAAADEQLTAARSAYAELCPPTRN